MSYDLSDFLAVVFEPDDLIELRAFPASGDGKATHQSWRTVEELASMNGELERINARDSVYFGANPRPKRGDSTNDTIRDCRCLFADFDGGTTWEEAEHRIDNAGLPAPSAVVRTGGGVHCWWRLTDATDPATFKATVQGLIATLGSDKAPNAPAQVMRLPGTINRKPERNNARCEIVYCNDDRHDLGEIAALLKMPEPDAEPAEPLAEGERRPLPGWIAGHIVNGAGEGERNGTAFKVAAALRGNGWTRDDAKRLVVQYAAACRPALPEAEALATLASAWSQDRKPTRNNDDPFAAMPAHEAAGMIGAGFGPMGPASERQPRPFTIGKLIEAHPKLSTPVIDGILRAGETGNIIAASKVGKSWLMYDLLVSLATGRRWLDTFECVAGRVLLIDNELHPQTIANRLPKVAAAMGVPMEDLAESIDVLPLRGKGITLDHLAAFINKIEPGTYAAIVLDAWYRFIPKGLSENSNADIMGLYNLLDQYAASTGAAIVAVHHASKGAQGDKAVTDVGAGAGAQSRAADAHIVLRPHEEDGCVVLEAAVRSYAPIEPVGLRWEFPRWHRADLDTGALKDRKTKLEHRREQSDAEGTEKIVAALRTGPLTPRKIRDATGLSKSRADRLLSRMNAGQVVVFEELKVRGQATREYRLAD
ncbi:AAA family ATPase [Phycisphaeraceae bacterium D3-23]